MPYFSNIILRLHSPGLISPIVTLQSCDCTFILPLTHVGDEAIGGCAMLSALLGRGVEVVQCLPLDGCGL